MLKFSCDVKNHQLCFLLMYCFLLLIIIIFITTSIISMATKRVGQYFVSRGDLRLLQKCVGTKRWEM